MRIEVLQIGQRFVRDDRVMTHTALVARAFNAAKIYMVKNNNKIEKTIKKINFYWGSNFKIEFVDNWKKIIKLKKKTIKLFI